MPLPRKCPTLLALSSKKDLAFVNSELSGQLLGPFHLALAIAAAHHWPTCNHCLYLLPLRAMGSDGGQPALAAEGGSNLLAQLRQREFSAAVGPVPAVGDPVAGAAAGVTLLPRERAVDVEDAEAGLAPVGCVAPGCTFKLELARREILQNIAKTRGNACEILRKIAKTRETVKIVRRVAKKHGVVRHGALQNLCNSLQASGLLGRRCRSLPKPQGPQSGNRHQRTQRRKNCGDTQDLRQSHLS
mmetsp:Transcript_26920/g.47905  ORF Transcript_26920/g.47905 Transcript_26920/m.47905 type:complete len:244 (-) Transcript_26920:105-836(-)